MVLLKVNSDTELGKELRKRFAVRGLPTTIVLSTEGAEVDRILGYPGRGDYLKTLLGYVYGVDTLDDLVARSAAEPEPALMSEVASKYLGRGDSAACLAWVVKAREAEGERPEGLARQLDLLEGQAWLGTEPDKGEAALKKLVLGASGPDDMVAEEAFSDLSRYYKRVKKDDKGLLELYDSLLPLRGEDPHFLNDYAWTFAEKGTNLDKALQAAQKAVELSEADPGILDTLAEVQFKRGDTKAAVATIDQAIAKKPDDEYFKQQRTKFLGEGKAKTKG